MQNSRTLKVDFYESGCGDTIVVTFPSGGIGIIDAHPSPSESRPSILEIVGEKQIHFVCLTHPHRDHGLDLIPVLNRPKKPESFWHTVSDIAGFVYGLQEVRNFPSEFNGFAKRLAEDSAKFHIEILGAVTKRGIEVKRLSGDLEQVIIDDVELHVLSPEQEIQNRFVKYWTSKAADLSREPPNENLLSSIIALRFGENVILLGADALQENWKSAVGRYRALKMPKAVVLKVPHHGAHNAIDLRDLPSHPTYLDICKHEINSKCHAVLFAGNSYHPDKKVEAKLKARTHLFCLSNGFASAHSDDPLRIRMKGVRPIRKKIPVCSPVVSFEIAETGPPMVISGQTCAACPNAR